MEREGGKVHKIGPTRSIRVIEEPRKYKSKFVDCGFKELGYWSHDINHLMMLPLNLLFLLHQVHYLLFMKF